MTLFKESRSLSHKGWKLKSLFIYLNNANNTTKADALKNPYFASTYNLLLFSAETHV